MPQSFIETAIRGGIRTAATISPGLGARAALPTLFFASPPMPLAASSSFAGTAAAQATTNRITVRGRPVVTYEWAPASGDRSGTGRGAGTVLLLHGWRGRATQFAPLIKHLTGLGFRVASFDAPAHGASPGRMTDLRDWIAAATQLHEQYDGFTGIIGHSLGGLAALTAARTSTPTPAVAVIATPTTPTTILSEFAQDLALPEAARSHLTRHFAARVNETATSLSDRYDAVAHPLPVATRLLVIHDRQDRRIPDSEGARLHAAHGNRSHLLRTDGLGHSRILAAEAVVHELGDFLTSVPLPQ